LEEDPLTKLPTLYLSTDKTVPQKVILITGGSGYIGSHLILRLLEEGHAVVAIDNFHNSKALSLERVNELLNKKHPFLALHQVNLLDKLAMKALFEAYKGKIDSVLHLAAYKSVGESVQIPLDYYDNNIRGSIQLFKFMKEYGIKKILFSSSSTVYDALNTKPPFLEDSPMRATNPYGRTKQMMEEALMDWSNSDPTLSIVILRYFNPVGAHPSGMIGEDPSGIPTNLFPFIYQVIGGQRDVLNVYGTDYQTEDGTAERDFIHIMDVVDAHVVSMKKFEETGQHIYNIGTKKPISVMKIVKAFEKQLGKEIPIKKQPRRKRRCSCFVL